MRSQVLREWVGGRVETPHPLGKIVVRGQEKSSKVWSPGQGPLLSRLKFSTDGVKVQAFHFGFILLKDRKVDINIVTTLM